MKITEGNIAYIC